MKKRDKNSMIKKAIAEENLGAKFLFSFYHGFVWIKLTPNLNLNIIIQLVLSG